MADFSQNKKYNYNWQSSKFKDLAFSGSYISQFINDVGYITSSNAASASYATSASYAATASYLLGSITSASYSLTSSYVNPLNQNVIITGSIYIPDNTNGIYFSGSGAASKLIWNNTDGTLDLGLKGGNVTLQVGQENVIRVVNKTGADLLEADFKVVRVRSVAEGGAQGQRLAVVLAQADSDADSATTLGIVTENISNNQEGFITIFGSVREIDTTGAKSYGGLETWVDGDMLYLSPNYPGYLTNVKPQAPQHLVIIGYIEYAHANNGKIFVKIDNGWEIGELHDVRDTTTSSSYGDLLVKSGSVWINSKQLTGLYGLTGSLTATSFTGSLLGTASYATSASYAPSTPTFPYTGSARITGSLGVTGSISLRAYTGSSDTIANITSTTGTQLAKIGGDGTWTLGTYTNPSTRFSINGNPYNTGLYVTGNSTGIYAQNETGTGTRSAITALGRQFGTATPSGYIAYGVYTGADTTLGINYGIRSYAFNGATNYAGYFDAAAGTNNYAIVTQRGYSGFGKIDPAAMVDIKAAGALSTDIALRVRNSGDTYNIISTRGDGIVDIQNSLGSLCIGGAGTSAAGAVILSYPGGTATAGLRSVAVGGNTNAGSDGVAIGYNVKVQSAGDGGIGVGQNITGSNGLSFGKTISNTLSTAIGLNLTIGGSGPTNNNIIAIGQGITETSGDAKLPHTFMFGSYATTGNKAGLSFRSNNVNHLLLGYDVMDSSYSNTSGSNWMGFKSGSVPTHSPNTFKIWASGSVGNVKPYFITENGTTVWFGDESRLFNVTASNLILSGSATIGFTSSISTENTLTLGPPPAGGTGEGGQLGLAAAGGSYTSASMIDTWQNQFRILRGTNAGSNAGLMYMDLQTGNTQFVGAVTASAYSGLPNDYLYATRSGSAQTVGSAWANTDIIFNNTVVSKGISYNTSTGLASLTGGKVYRVTARLAWGAAASYNLQFSCYDSSNTQIGPTVEIIQSTNGTNNISDGTLEFIYAPGSNIDIKIRTTGANTALSGETIRADLNTQFIIQQIA